MASKQSCGKGTGAQLSVGLLAARWLAGGHDFAESLVSDIETQSQNVRGADRGMQQQYGGERRILIVGGV